MKKLITIIALAAFCCSSAFAGDCNTKKNVKRHHHVTHNKTGNAVVQVASPQPIVCRIEPYRVCKIQPDRKTVRCYKTTDVNTLAPMNDEATYYGATGAMPQDELKQTLPTVFVNKGLQGGFCRRNDDNKSTTCFYDSQPMTRDAQGNYHY